MMPSAWLLAMALLLSSFLPPLATGASTYATVCGEATYKNNSNYEHNVQQATDYLVKYAAYTTGTGFATVTYADAPDVVYGLGLCRGDTPDNFTCYQCLSTASEMAPLLCPYQKDATLFYDGCIMRFSDQDFLKTVDNEPLVVVNATETMKPTDVVASNFDALVDRLMDKTVEHAAASNITGRKMATGEAVFDSGDQHAVVYSLVQCTPDLTPTECTQCLDKALDSLALTRRGSLGERAAGVRCNVRYEVYPFYVGQAMVVLDGSEGSSSPPPPKAVVTPPASPQNKKGMKSKIWIIAVSVSLVLLFFCIFIAFMWIRSRYYGEESSTAC